MTAPQALTGLGGPVILGGDDLTDHGYFAAGAPQAGWVYIQKAQENIKARVTRPNDGTVAILGSSDSTYPQSDAGGAYHYTAPLAGLTPEFYNGVGAIDAFFHQLQDGTKNPAILVMPGTDAGNNLDTAEGATLAIHAADIANFVNSGGGLLSHGFGEVAYGWLSVLIPGIVESDGCDSMTLQLSPEGQAAFPGVTNDHIQAGPCHSHFSGDLGGLQVLASDGNQRNVIIGGAAVHFQSRISLSPPTATYVIGVTNAHTVVATVGGSNLNPVAGASITFRVVSGPNAGATGTAVTDAQGQVSFTYPSNGNPGTDNIVASFVDTTGTLQTSQTVEAVWQASPDSSCIDFHLNDYNLFLLEDYSGGHDVLGKVAAGGNLSMTDFSVGAQLPASDISNVLVAGHNLSLSRGAIWGDAAYGGTYSADGSVVSYRGTVAKGTPINFAARGAELRSLSAQLDSLATNGSSTRESWGGVMLSGSDPVLNVFDVNASVFNGATLLSINAPAGAWVVINIHGASATFTNFGHVFSGGINASGVLYNFVDATSINAQNYSFWGTILAPKADITFNSGSWDGGIYAKSLTGNAEGHINPLMDICCPIPCPVITLVPSASSAP